MNTLSREGLIQLNSNCAIAPIQLQNVVSKVSIEYPNFASQFKGQLDGIKTTTEQLSKALAGC